MRTTKSVTLPSLHACAAAWCREMWTRVTLGHVCADRSPLVAAVSELGRGDDKHHRRRSGRAGGGAGGPKAVPLVKGVSKASSAIKVIFLTGRPSGGSSAQSATILLSTRALRVIHSTHYICMHGIRGHLSTHFAMLFYVCMHGIRGHLSAHFATLLLITPVPNWKHLS